MDSDVPTPTKKKKKSADSDEEFVSLADKSATTPRAARGKAKKAKYNFSSSEEDNED